MLKQILRPSETDGSCSFRSMASGGSGFRGLGSRVEEVATVGDVQSDT